MGCFHAMLDEWRSGTLPVPAPPTRRRWYPGDMHLRVLHLQIDCLDPLELGKFWSEAIGGELVPDNRGYVLKPPPGSQTPSILFNMVLDTLSAGAPRLRMNSAEGTLKAEVERVTSLGARIVRDDARGPQGMVGLGEVVLADPEGNEFIVESSDAEVETVERALQAGEDVDLSGSYFAGRPQDPTAFVRARTTAGEN